MKVCGIIAEYNPFHNGHQYQIRFLKEELGMDYVVVVMSGDFVQRGEPALISKYDRTRMALSGGADLVLELPAAWATGSAEFFARGGVETLNALGTADCICFGAEHEDLSLLQEISRLFPVREEEDGKFKEALREGLSSGLSYPAARQEAVRRMFSGNAGDGEREALLDEILNSPNDLLGIEYLRALSYTSSPLRPIPLKRLGSSYLSEKLDPELLPSASAVRKAVRCKAFPEEQAAAFLPPEAADILCAAVRENRTADPEDLDLLLFYCLLSETPGTFENYQDMSPALARRILNSRGSYEGFLPFASSLKTRELTLSRIRRALLHILLKLEGMPGQIPFIRILGFRREAAPLLKEIRKNASLPVISRAAEGEHLTGYAAKAYQDTVFASNLYQSVISRKSNTPFVHEYKKRIVIL